MNVIDRLLKRPLKIEKRLENIFNVLNEISKTTKRELHCTYCFEYNNIAIKIYKSDTLLFLSCYTKQDGFNYDNFIHRDGYFGDDTVKKIFSMAVYIKKQDVKVWCNNITAEEIDNIIKDIEEHVNKEYYNLKPKADKLIAVNKYFMR